MNAIDVEDLQRAWRDLEGSLGRAAQWFALQGRPNWVDYAGNHALRLAALVAILVVGGILLRRGRIALDARIEAIATRLPGGVGATVSARGEEAAEDALRQQEEEVSR